MRAVALLAVLSVLAACSSQPTTPQVEAETPATAAPAPAAAGSVTAPAAPTQGTTESTAAASSTGKIPSGYRREKRNGKELFCRNVTTLGSRFPQKTCFTREQLEEIERRTESAMGDLEQGIKVCGPSNSCGNGT